eukprot:Protomagalhaensia_sp_Gyna_25__47@NODE_1021_length_2281_cov_79_095897_g784_i1_p2_GENE_NODE_1021_length_2281_cov_79_095897_g784_i1NODE_1021_length_2281_cov_79_095897_g784_i1_p2_ORF_typecomplete_len199_score36_52AAA_18/PF13238_6/1e27AAA_33/PF13671_6/3_8e09AAA_17/PF13207_6/6_2e07RuvB_N/PF05496_12/1_4e05SKI/PF01202_22/0_00012PRK/PF00485_18/0_00025AAA_5/PF07728_14/0_00025KTI12/PF08433_10/0_00066APS_kinase/PF01583_20/0_0011ADK/PF00406_22/0_0065NACHT/PF05729_12/0_0012IstB_IS21/PF01695_17/0_0014AAA_22/PF
MLPNILILGTPGCGKTTFAGVLVDALNAQVKGTDQFRHIEVSKLIKNESLYEEWDEERDCSIYDEELVAARVDELIAESHGGCIVDFHSVYPFEIEWFSCFILLRCGTQALFDRLSERGYSTKKVEENVEAEIFGVVREELVDVMPEVEHQWLASIDKPAFGEPGLLPGCFEFMNESFELSESHMQKVLAWMVQQGML